MNTFDVLELLELEEFDSTAIADDDFYNYLTIAEFMEHYYPADDCSVDDECFID